MRSVSSQLLQMQLTYGTLQGVLDLLKGTPAQDDPPECPH